MIVLLNCLSSWSRNDASSSFMGEVTTDSVLVSIDDLRVANAKMTELKYEKEVNLSLKEIVKNDSIAINALREENYINKAQLKDYKKQRNILGGVSIGTLILLVISLIK